MMSWSNTAKRWAFPGDFLSESDREKHTADYAQCARNNVHQRLLVSVRNGSFFFFIFYKDFYFTIFDMFYFYIHYSLSFLFSASKIYAPFRKWNPFSQQISYSHQGKDRYGQRRDWSAPWPVTASGQAIDQTSESYESLPASSSSGRPFFVYYFLSTEYLQKMHQLVELSTLY